MKKTLHIISKEDLGLEQGDISPSKLPHELMSIASEISLLCIKTAEADTINDTSSSDQHVNHTNSKSDTLYQVLKHEQHGRQTAVQFVKTLSSELQNTRAELSQSTTKLQSLQDQNSVIEARLHEAQNIVTSLEKQLQQNQEEYQAKIEQWLDQEVKWETTVKTLSQELESEKVYIISS